MVFFIVSCDKDNTDEDSCEKLWEVEINNPKATVKITNGVLKIVIPNPKTAYDVRLNQRQTKYYPDQSVELYVKYKNLRSVYKGGVLYHPMFSGWFAYDYAPNKLLVGVRTGAFGSRLEFNDEARMNLVGSSTYASEAEIELQVHNQLDVGVKLNVSPGGLGYGQIPFEFQSDPLVFHLDFGINSIYHDNTNQSDTISIEIEQVTFREHVKAELNEFKGDYFDCNSLIGY